MRRQLQQLNVQCRQHQALSIKVDAGAERSLSTQKAVAAEAAVGMAAVVEIIKQVQAARKMAAVVVDLAIEIRQELRY